MECEFAGGSLNALLLLLLVVLVVLLVVVLLVLVVVVAINSGTLTGLMSVGKGMAKLVSIALFALLTAASEIQGEGDERPVRCSLFGPGWVHTFDGSVYDFSGVCSYQLAGDCAGNSFSLLVSYEDGEARGLSLYVPAQALELQLFTNGTCILDGHGDL
ncbi:von Willebrand factor-like [Lethenteron reissneri]|uniref:von Willebrand factor-like n=1 Tax=Lethenteron reissneri TaxID=7753 RepID=UPI002AB7A2AC|nr:von Willebrand factor-like [Lethenteron reissneri]